MWRKKGKLSVEVGFLWIAAAGMAAGIKVTQEAKIELDAHRHNINFAGSQHQLKEQSLFVFFPNYCLDLSILK